MGRLGPEAALLLLLGSKRLEPRAQATPDRRP